MIHCALNLNRGYSIFSLGTHANIEFIICVCTCCFISFEYSYEHTTNKMCSLDLLIILAVRQDLTRLCVYRFKSCFVDPTCTHIKHNMYTF